MKNKLVDLNNHLFAQLERLGDEDLKPENIKAEVKRTEAIVSVSNQIIENAKISLEAAKLISSHGGKNFLTVLPAIEGKPAIMDFSK